MKQYSTLDTTVQKEPLYKRMYNSVGRGAKKVFSNKYVVGGGLGAIVAGAALLSPEIAQAAQQTSGEIYGFGSGLWDGFLVVPNFVMNLFSDSTWAADGNGIFSEPNTGAAYYLGVVMTGGAEGLCTGVVGGAVGRNS